MDTSFSNIVILSRLRTKSLVFFFIQQILVEYLLCARHYAKPWNSCENTSLCPMELIFKCHLHCDL